MFIRNDYPILEFDDNRDAKINPTTWVDKKFECNKMVITFFPEVVDKLIADGKIVLEKTIGGENIVLVYRFVETVCLLSKLHEAKHHVNVRLDMDELDVTLAESKATYEEIKKYVAEHYDRMKVSNLYIAQVKAKYGIIERENYNKPKSDDARQPKCPKEKENAIVEALRYFRMI